MSGLTTSFNIILEVLARTLGQEEEKDKEKNNLNWKGRCTLFLFADDMILYIEIPKVSIFTHKKTIIVNE